jgi:hypothetical protein
LENLVVIQTNKNPGNTNKNSFLFGLSTQNIQNLLNPNKKTRNSSKNPENPKNESAKSKK